MLIEINENRFKENFESKKPLNGEKSKYLKKMIFLRNCFWGYIYWLNFNFNAKNTIWRSIWLIFIIVLIEIKKIKFLEKTNHDWKEEF